MVDKSIKNLEKVNNNSIENIKTLQNATSKITAKANQSDYNYKEDHDYKKILQTILEDISDDSIRFPENVAFGYRFKDPEIAYQNKILPKILYDLYERYNSVKPNSDDFKIFDNITNKLDSKDIIKVSLLMNQIFGMQANQPKDDSKNSYFMDIHSLAHIFFYSNETLYETEYQGPEFEVFYFFFQKYLELSKLENQEIVNKRFNEFINIDTNYKNLL